MGNTTATALALDIWALDAAIKSAGAALDVYDRSVTMPGITAGDWDSIALSLTSAQERMQAAGARAGSIEFVRARAVDAAQRAEVLRRGDGQGIVVDSIVRLADDQIGQVAAIKGDTFEVVQNDRKLGRGPWDFHRSLVQLADPDAANLYSRARARLRQRIPVIGASRAV